MSFVKLETQDMLGPFVSEQQITREPRSFAQAAVQAAPPRDRGGLPAAVPRFPCASA